jgi:hypothetical protein
MSGIFSSSKGVPSDTSVYGAPSENMAAQEPTAMMMASDIWIQSQMEDAAKGTGIGTVGGKTHMPGQGPGEIGVVGIVSHAPQSGKAMLPSERAAQLQLVAVALDSQYQSGQIDQATYNANQAAVIAEANALARYPSVTNMYPTAGAPTKFQSAMDSALGQVAAYRASKDAGVQSGPMKLGGTIAPTAPAVQMQQAPQVQQVQQVQRVQPAATSKESTSRFLTAMSNAAKNITSIITKTPQSQARVLTPSEPSHVTPQYNIEDLMATKKAQQNIITLPAITMMPGQSVGASTVQSKTGQALKSLTSPGQTPLNSGQSQQLAVTKLSINAINVANAQMQNNTVNSIVGVSVANKAPVVIPISQQALSKMNLANAIVPNSVASPIVSNQVMAQANLANRITANQAVQAAAASVKTNVAQPVTRTITFQNTSQNVASYSAPAAAKASYSAPAPAPAPAASKSSGAVKYSGGVAYIGSVGKGK